MDKRKGYVLLLKMLLLYSLTFFALLIWVWINDLTALTHSESVSPSLLLVQFIFWHFHKYHLLNQLQVFMRYKKLPKWALISFNTNVVPLATSLRKNWTSLTRQLFVKSLLKVQNTMSHSSTSNYIWMMWRTFLSMKLCKSDIIRW
jgi:hypothetical protein